MVIWRASAVCAEEAVNWVATVSLVGVDLEITLGELECTRGSQLVQSVFSAGLQLASVTMAENVTLRVFGQLDVPFDCTAVATTGKVCHVG